MDKNRIYSHFEPKVRGYIAGKLGASADTEDLVQTVFLKVFSALPSFDQARASLGTWIFTVTRNTVTDYFRTLRLHQPIDEAAFFENSCAVSRDELDDLADALMRLDTRQRDLIILHYYRRMTLKEIAEGMGVSYATAKNIHNKALEELKESLK